MNSPYMQRAFVRNAGLGALALCILLTGLASDALGQEARTDMQRMRAILADTGDSREKLAAETLSRYIAQMFDVRIEINPDGVEASPEARDVILVGRKAALASGAITAAELDALAYGGFIVRVGDGRIVLAGNGGRGAVYGVYELLERWGGRFYAPRVEVIPRLDSSLADDLDITDQPAFQYRSGSWWAGRDTVGLLGDPRQGLNPELFTREAGSNLWLDHTSGYLVPKLLYYDDHPEYYALRPDGTRIPKTTPDNRLFLCSSHPDVVRISIERTLGWMRLQPEQRYFMIAVGDGPEWCRCDSCLAQDREPGNYSDRLLEFVNAIGRAVKPEFPDNVLITLAYIGSEYAPVEKRPESNVLVFYCPYFGIGRSMAHPLTHPLNVEALSQLEGWLAVAPGRMAIYDYNMANTPSWDAMASKIPWFAEQEMIGVWHCGRPVCFQDLFNYMISRLMWDPTRDPEALKAEFVTAYYGAAAPHIMAYLERVRERLNGGFPKMVYEASMPPDYYSVDFTRAAIGDFTRALAAVADDQELTLRVEREYNLLLDDYLIAVTLATDGVDGRGIVRPAPNDAQREQALGFFKQRLLEMVERDALPRDMRSRLNAFAGLALPEDAEIVAVARDFVDDHAAVMSRFGRAPREPAPAERIEGGLRLTAASFEGGMGPMRYAWYCPPRETMIIGTQQSPRRSEMKADFDLDAAPAGAVTLRMEGQDADKDIPPPAKIAIIVNGREIYAGDSGFVRRGWSWREFPVAPGILKAGRNTIEIRNIADHPRTVNGRMDHFWFALSEVQFLF